MINIVWEGKSADYRRIFTISDLHLGHSAIIKLCNRPFESVEEMDEKMLKFTNRTVGKNDLLIFLGDFCYWKKAHRITFNKYIDLINCENIFWVFGNHDYKIKGDIQKHKKVAWSGDRLTCRINSKDMIFDHFPLSSWYKKNYGSIHYHGHIHNSPIEDVQNRKNVSVEMVDYMPVELF